MQGWTLSTGQQGTIKFVLYGAVRGSVKVKVHTKVNSRIQSNLQVKVSLMDIHQVAIK